MTFTAHPAAVIGAGTLIGEGTRICVRGPA